MSFKSKAIALTIGLTLAFSGSIGSYAYFTNKKVASNNSIALGNWINPKTTNADKDKSKTEVNNPNKNVSNETKANESNKNKQEVKSKEVKSKEVKQEAKSYNENNNTKKEIKPETKKENTNTNKEENKTLKNNIESNKVNK